MKRTQNELDECGALEIEHLQALDKATECTLGAAQQCTKKVFTSFDCPCMGVVNDDAQLSMLEQRFAELGCQATKGCAVSCPSTTTATCQADATSSTGARCLSGDGS